jgi:DNA-binding FadR family transcriptional regulator
MSRHRHLTYSLSFKPSWTFVGFVPVSIHKGKIGSVGCSAKMLNICFIHQVSGILLYIFSTIINPFLPSGVNWFCSRSKKLAKIAQGMDTPEAIQSGSASIAARLRRAILEGEYSYQTRLPAERELAEFFSASRGTIRAALNQLEEMGLLVRRVGSGTFVIYKADSELLDGEGGDIAEITSPLELIEARLAIEPHMIKLAALNASNRDLEQLRKILENLEDCQNDRECFSRADEQFHLGLAAASHNRLIYWFYKKLSDVRSHAQWGGMKKLIVNPDNINTYNTQHRALLNALENRDIERAEKLMIAHLEKARLDLLSVRSS